MRQLFSTPSFCEEERRRQLDTVQIPFPAKIT